MADETIQDDHPVIPPASVPKAEREPVTIDAEAISASPETPEDEPPHAEASEAESTPAESPAAAPAEASRAPAEPFQQTPPPKSQPRGFPVVISAGVGALIGAAAALAVSYVFQPSAPDLQPLTDKVATLDSAISGEVTARKALEARLATLEAKPGPAAPSKDTAALEARLKKLEGSTPNTDALAAIAGDAKTARSDAAKALATVASLGAANASADGGAPNPEIARLVGDQQSLGDRFAKLEAAVGALKSAAPAGPDPELEKLAGDEKALDQRVVKLEAAFSAPKTDVRADPNVVAKGDPVAQSVAAIELERRLTAGQGYAVEWAALDKLGADAKSLAALQTYAQSGAPTLSTLSAGFAKLAPDLGTPAKKPDNGSYTDVLWDEVKGLVKVHPAGEIKGDDPTAVTTQIQAALARGDVVAARAGYAKLPEKQRELAASWAKDLDGVLQAKAAAMSLIETSLSRLADQKN